jgi:type IV pilus assembly protein PilM
VRRAFEQGGRFQAQCPEKETKMFLLQRKYRPLLGLDITTSSVKLIELAMAGGQYRVEAYAAEPTPQNAINEKAIVDAEAVGEAIRRAVKRAGAKSGEVAVAISGDAAITKVIQMPRALRTGDLESQVEMQADQYIPFPMDEVSYDFEVLGPNDKDPESNDVLLVATRTENVEQRQAAVKSAGLAARIVDVEAFALENACKLMTHQMPDGGIDRTIAVVDFGASSTTFSVLRNLKVVYTRDFAFGGQQLTEEIMRTYGLSMEEAGRAKKEGGLPGNYQSEVLDPFIDDMTQQVSRSLQFYLASGSGREQPEKILVCGGCANISGVAEVISSRVGIAAEKGDPLGQMKLSSRAKAQAVQRDATALLTACGLALRSFD